MSGDQATDRERVVYHRGRVVFAIDKATGALRHVLDVSNGAACGCICEECGSNLIAKANLPGATYEREEHFAHESGAECQGTGKRGLVHAYRAAILARGSMVLPAAMYSLAPDRVRDQVFAPALESGVVEVSEVPGEFERPLELLISTSAGAFRCVVAVRQRPTIDDRESAERAGVNLLWVSMAPDAEGKIRLGDLLDELAGPVASHWVHHAGAAERQRVAHQEEEARVLAEARKREEEREQVEERVRQERPVAGRPAPSVERREEPPRLRAGGGGRFYCSRCRNPDAPFVPDSPGSRFGHCGSCGAGASPTILH